MVVIGGANSNNVLSAAQTLKENNIKITPFLLGPPSQKLGNAKLFSLFVDDSEIHWISRSQLERLRRFSQQLCGKRKALGVKIFVLPEGAHHPLALPGSLSILVDILLRNERESGVRFDHVFIDAGTGMVAQSLMAGAAALGRKTIFHVVVLAGSFEDFNRGLSQVMQYTEEFLDVSPCPLPDYHLYYPATAKVIWQYQQDYFQGNKAYCQRGWNSHGPCLLLQTVSYGKANDSRQNA